MSLAGTSAAVPTRSDVEGWNTSDLDAAASRWHESASASEAAFEQHRQIIMAPGGTTWEGDAKDVALDRATADLAVVVRQGDVHRVAADIAAQGSEDIRGVRKRVLETIAEAEEDGFRVGGDLSVTDARKFDLQTAAARATAVVEHAEFIRWRAEQLVATDVLVGQQLQSKAVELAGIRFEGEGEWESQELPTIQAVNYGPMPATPAPDPSLLGDSVGTGGRTTGGEIRGVIDKLPQGSQPWIREVRTPQDLENLWKWMRQNGVEAPNGGYGDPAKGTAVVLPDGTRVGQRFAAGSTGNPVLDLKFPDESNAKIHIGPRGGVPEIPGAQPPRLPAPVEPPLARGGGVPGGFFGGAPTADFLPQVIEPRHAGDTDLPVVGDGKPDNPEF